LVFRLRLQIGEQFGVPGIGLRPGDVVAGNRERVDREHLIAGRGERFDPQAAAWRRWVMSASVAGSVELVKKG